MTTWRVFPTETAARRYALACWLVMLHDRAAGGTLRRIDTDARTELGDDDRPDWPATLPEARTFLQNLTTEQRATLAERLRRLPLLGRRLGLIRTDGGYTTAWAIPRLTADGRWAVQCPPFDPGGDPAPEWPKVDTIL